MTSYGSMNMYFEGLIYVKEIFGAQLAAVLDEAFDRLVLNLPEFILLMYRVMRESQTFQTCISSYAGTWHAGVYQ